jgi:hypothetical protein
VEYVVVPRSERPGELGREGMSGVVVDDDAHMSRGTGSSLSAL